MSGLLVPPPRVLLIMPSQWPRALLRAALRDVGYDAVGVRDLRGALRMRPVVTDRGPVRLILLDQEALTEADGPLRQHLLDRYPDAATMLVARVSISAPSAPAARPWTRVLHRPASVAELVTAVQWLVPLPCEARGPID